MKDEHGYTTVIACFLLTYTSLQWSFGVTMWEVFSGGQMPYHDVDAFMLVELLHCGKTLSHPENDACTDQL